MWWDINVVLSYVALFFFIVGMRGGGKSYGMKKHVIKRWLKHKEQFMYVRRYKEEFDESAKTFFDDLIANGEFPDCEFEYKGKKFYCNGEIMGHGMILSTSSKKKSLSFPNVWWIIFDEFMLDPKKKAIDRYLPNEVDIVLNLYETVARSRDVKMFFISNALSWVNPYFIYFKIERPRNKKQISVNNDVLIQLYTNKEFKKMKDNTRFGKMIKGTEFYSHAVDNEFIRDNNNFIRKPFAKQRYFFTLKASGVFYGVYIAHEDGCLFVSENYDKNYPMVYVAILDNHEPNMMLMSGSSPPFKRFITMFKNGYVYYDCQRTKNTVFEIMKGK